MQDGGAVGPDPSRSSREPQAKALDLCPSASPAVKLGKGLQLSSAE